jgi:restriction system protein
MDRGFRNVRIVPPGPDFGLDIYMTCPNGKKAIVQCKKYAAKHLVDRPVIQQTFGVMHLLSAKKCYVVTTSSFTRDALELGQRKDIVLLDGAVLASERSARIKTRISIAKKTVDHSKPTNYKKKA